MKRYELIIIGAGPAGLSAAIEAASMGMKAIVFDENSKPGGQLFKQIHKFFGSKEHRARERGFRIGEKLLQEAETLGVEVVLEATVLGIFQNKEISVMIDGGIKHYRSNNIIIATGASENMVPFPGWTLPGVIGAGAAQTMMNLHGLKPGKKILMVGSGNVGLVVGYQLIQAGCELVGIIDGSSKIGGYGVHASKVARLGVPFYTSHTIKEAHGVDKVEGATIIEVDSKWKMKEETEKYFEVDTICIAVGLSPMFQLAATAGCKIEDIREKGGLVPVCNKYGETSISGIYAVGDVAGIEEASSAMIQGKIAGANSLLSQGYIDEIEFESRFKKYNNSLLQLRGGMFGKKNKGNKDLTHTEEGYKISSSLLKKGFLQDEEVLTFPGAASKLKGKKGTVPIIECTQNIPCNPCQNVCVKGCIKVGDVITNLPQIDDSVTCTGCGMCVTSCPGQAIFLVNENADEDYATVSIPYELLPLPEEGSKGMALDRAGKVLGEAEIISVKKFKAADETALLTMRVPLEWSMKARFFKLN